ncbi:MAG TPA: CHC2 zinc finger domain-containing protein, partial [Saprospiraceae bacterium]|nr:CHC2 zinc finger domain-containing protein [Saprospiraceae bacterium]
MIKRHSIEKVLDTAQVEEVVGEYVDLKRRGVNLIGLCPFHNEKTPSFTVSPTKNIYKCFGCGKGGNPVNFLMEHEGFNFPEAIRFLAQRYGIELDETERTPEAIEKDQERDSLYIINEYAKDFFQDQLMNSDEGRKIGYSYFKQRGYLQNTIEEFQLGYCPKSGS